MYAIVFTASLYRYPKYYDTRLKYLPILFFYTLLNEILGYITAYMPQFGFFSRESIAGYNMVIYNIYNTIFFLYFFFIYKHHIRKRSSQNAIYWGAIIFSGVALTNPFLQSFLLSPQTATYVVGGIFLLACIFLYIKELLEKGKDSPFKNNLLIWISLGSLVFYIGYLPIKISRLVHSVNQTIEAPYVRLVQYGLIITMYLIILIGFVRLKSRLPSQGP